MRLDALNTPWSLVFRKIRNDKCTHWRMFDGESAGSLPKERRTGFLPLRQVKGLISSRETTIVTLLEVVPEWYHNKNRHSVSREEG